MECEGDDEGQHGLHGDRLRRQRRPPAPLHQGPPQPRRPQPALVFHRPAGQERGPSFHPPELQQEEGQEGVQVVAKLESVVAAAPSQAMTRVSLPEVHFAVHMIQRHGDDFVVRLSSHASFVWPKEAGLGGDGEGLSERLPAHAQADQEEDQPFQDDPPVPGLPHGQEDCKEEEVTHWVWIVSLLVLVE